MDTTQTAPVRETYLDLDILLKNKYFHILTTNQDTQFIKLYPEDLVSEIQGEHWFFQCSRQCSDDTWDAVEPFWQLTKELKNAYYISINDKYALFPEFIEDKGIAVLCDIGIMLKDLRKAKKEQA